MVTRQSGGWVGGVVGWVGVRVGTVSCCFIFSVTGKEDQELSRGGTSHIA